jgi:hypothetical protein
MTTRYRWVTPTRKGRWTSTSKAARDAAVIAGVALKDDQGRVFLDPFTEIEAKTRDI